MLTAVSGILLGEEVILYNSRERYYQYPTSFFQRYFSTHMFLFATPDFSSFVRMAESVGLGFKVLRSFFCENVTGLTNRGQLRLFAQKFSSD